MSRKKSSKVNEPKSPTVGPVGWRGRYPGYRSSPNEYCKHKIRRRDCEICALRHELDWAYKKLDEIYILGLDAADANGGEEWRKHVLVQRTYCWRDYSEFKSTPIGWDIKCLGHYWSPSRCRWIRYNDSIELFGVYQHEGQARDDALGIAFGPQVEGVGQ